MAIKEILIQTLRSVLGVFFGIMLISLIAEGIEFLLVALVHGSITTDQDVYFEIRNRPAMLAAKFIYNSVAALAGALQFPAFVAAQEDYRRMGVDAFPVAALPFGQGLQKRDRRTLVLCNVARFHRIPPMGRSGIRN